MSLINTRRPSGSNPDELDTRRPSRFNSGELDTRTRGPRSGSNHHGELDTRGPSGFPSELESNPGEVDKWEPNNFQGSGSEALLDNLICHSRVLTDAEKHELLITQQTGLCDSQLDTNIRK